MLFCGSKHGNVLNWNYCNWKFVILTVITELGNTIPPAHILVKLDFFSSLAFATFWLFFHTTPAPTFPIFPAEEYMPSNLGYVLFVPGALADSVMTKLQGF